MPKRYKPELSQEQEVKLKRWLKNPPKPYLRERARAILKVAEGIPIEQVAQQLRVRVDRRTVAEWVRRFEAAGVEGLKIKGGRGRKPTFSPSEPD